MLDNEDRHFDSPRPRKPDSAFTTWLRLVDVLIFQPVGECARQLAKIIHDAQSARRRGRLQHHRRSRHPTRRRSS